MAALLDWVVGPTPLQPGLCFAATGYMILGNLCRCFAKYAACAGKESANELPRARYAARSHGGMVVYTNEKLAQKIGRALKKAYDGRVEYKWPEDGKLIRVNWRRD